MSTTVKRIKMMLSKLNKKTMVSTTSKKTDRLSAQNSERLKKLFITRRNMNKSKLTRLKEIKQRKKLNWKKQRLLCKLKK